MNKAKLSAITIMIVLAFCINADKALASSFLLTAKADGNGSGTISSTVGGINYNYPFASTGSAMLDSGTTSIILTATAISGSTVAWSGDCSSTSGTDTNATCTVNIMIGAKTVTADYRLASCSYKPVVNNSTTDQYWTIQSAYDGAGNGDIILVQAGDFAEDLTLANTFPVKLYGGYSCTYSPNSGMTKVHGRMIAKGGTVTVDKITIASGNAAITEGFAGTQSPGDFWTWSKTITNNGSINFSASNITQSFNYSGSENLLTGNSSGISKLNVTKTTDPGVTVPASAYSLEVPNTALLVAPAMDFFGSKAQFSIQPPVFAAAQGSCPAAGATLIWVTMPTKSWCPIAGSTNPFGSGCANADIAFGTAALTVSGGTYAITVTPYILNGTQGSPFSFTGCTCSGGLILCTDNGNPVRISFTPSGVFFVDTPNDAIVGLVQPESDINLNDFLAAGKVFKGVMYASVDSSLWEVGASCGPTGNCSSYGGTCIESGGTAGVVCSSPTTQLFSATADGLQMPVRSYTNIDNGIFFSDVVGSLSFGTAAQSHAHGLIQGKVASDCGTIDDIVMAVRKIDNKYVGLILAHSTCTTFDVGDNALMVEQ